VLIRLSFGGKGWSFGGHLMGKQLSFGGYSVGKQLSFGCHSVVIQLSFGGKGWDLPMDFMLMRLFF